MDLMNLMTATSIIHWINFQSKIMLYFLLGDFDIDFWIMTNIYQLMNSLTLSLSIFWYFLPHVVQPTRIRNNFRTLIDSIYSNVITPINISSNLIATISDHLPQFPFAPDTFANPPSTKFFIFFERDWFNFDPGMKNGLDWEYLSSS